MTCIKRIELCIGQHDRKNYELQALDSAGLPEDLSGAQEITFVVATSVSGAILLTKTKTGGDITLGNGQGTNDLIQFTITSAESGLMTGAAYCELQIINSLGYPSTAGAGPFRVVNTIIGD